MKPKCRHQFQRSSERQGNRYVTTFHCPLCKKTVKRSQKIPTPKEAKPRQRIRIRSLKRQKEEAEYNRRRIPYLQAHPKCPITGEPTTDIHHKCGREGPWLLREEFWMAVSRRGHDWIENNRAAAKALGYLLPRRPSK